MKEKTETLKHCFYDYVVENDCLKRKVTILVR